MTGILALQGAFAEHAQCLQILGEPFVYIRVLSDLEGVDRLILPGGESTTIRRLLRVLGLFSPLRERIQSGMPVLGTCAGLILLSQEIAGEPEPVLATLPVSVVRNGYGRQLGSFSCTGDIGAIQDFPMRFIRAPYIQKVLSEEAEVLSRTDGRITAVRFGNQLGLAFHPELTGDLRIHQAFMKM